MYFVRFLAGYVRLFGDASIRRLKPLLGKGCQTNSLPTGLNRISWKPSSPGSDNGWFSTLPIGSNRISWKRSPQTISNLGDFAKMVITD